MNVEEHLKKNNVSYEVLKHPPAYTSQESAHEQHVSGKMVAKAVLVKAGKEDAMCVLPAHLKLDMSKAAKALRCKRVCLVDEAELARVFPDAEVGAEPPFGNLYDLRTVVDERLAAREQIVCRAGSHDRSIRLRYEDYAKLVQPDVADISAHA